MVDDGTGNVYREKFRPLAERLERIPHAAWADLNEWIPQPERAAMFVIPRANFIQWRMIVHAQDIFGTNGPIRMTRDPDGLSLLYIEDGANPLGVEFGKAGNGLCRRKNANPKNRGMLGQMRFFFMDEEPLRFNLVHTIVGEGLSAHIDQVALTMESDEGIEWRWVLSDSTEDRIDGFDIPVRPADPQDGPPAPTIVPKAPATDGAERRRKKHSAG